VKRATALPLIAGLIGAQPSFALAQPAASGTPYKIGLTYPLTGPLAQITGEFIPAAELAAADVNRHGGVHGRPVQLDVEDTQATPQGGLAALRKLVQVDGVQAVLTIYTNVATAQIPLADQLKVPIIAPVEAPGVMSAGQYSFAHAVGFADVGPLLTRYWRQVHAKRIFAFLGNNGYGHTVEPAVRDAVRASGAEYDEAYVDLDATDYRGSVIRAKGYDPDQIVVSVQGGPPETSIVRQLRELGVTSQLVNPSDFYQSKSWREAAGPYAEGMIFGGLYVDPTISSDFVRAYRAKAGSDPVYGAAEVYDMVKIMAYAIGKGGYTGDGVRSALLSLRGVPSVFGGEIEMKPNHYTKISAIGLFRVRAGKLTKIPLAAS
jgi:branched-chain amino acid transport system substrate-binding protein